MQKPENIRERKTVLIRQRDLEALVGGRGLQFQIEGPAETLAQRESPRFVDAASERRVNHQLHPTAFVEEPLRDDRGLRGNGSEHRPAGNNVLDSLLGPGTIQPAFCLQPANGLSRTG
jgi:hypothetical protein